MKKLKRFSTKDWYALVAVDERGVVTGEPLSLGRSPSEATDNQIRRVMFTQGITHDQARALVERPLARGSYTHVPIAMRGAFQCDTKEPPEEVDDDWVWRAFLPQIPPSPMSDNTASNDWVQVFSGRQFFPTRPDASHVRVVDIAHALSHQCRFAGHVPVFYCVADHSVRVAKYLYDLAKKDGESIPKDVARIAMVGLLHDAAEAYVQDVVRPIKYLAGMEGYRDMEDAVIRVIFARYGLDPWLLDQDWLKMADNVVLATEKRDLIPTPPKPWLKLPDPLPEVIVPLSAVESKAAFLNMFHHLAQEMGMQERA